MTDVLCLVDDVYVDDHSAEEAAVQQDAELILPPPPPHLHMGQEEAEEEDEQALPIHNGQQQQQLLPTSQIPTLVEAALSENAAYMFSEELAAGQAWATTFSHPAVLVVIQFAWCVSQRRQFAADVLPALSSEGEGTGVNGCRSGVGARGSSSGSSSRDSSSGSGSGSEAEIRGQGLSKCDSYCQYLYGVRLMSIYVFYVSTFDGPPGLLTWAWICAVSAWFLGPGVPADGGGGSASGWSTAETGNRRSSSLGGSTLFFGTLESIDAEQQNIPVQDLAMDAAGIGRSDGGAVSGSLCLGATQYCSPSTVAAATSSSVDTGTAAAAADQLPVVWAAWFGVAFATASSVLVGRSCDGLKGV